MHSESFESFQRLRILSKYLVIWNFIVVEKDGNKWMIRQESVDKCFSKKAILGRCDVLPVSTHPFFKANRGQTGERAKKRRGTKGRVIDSRNGGWKITQTWEHAFEAHSADNNRRENEKDKRGRRKSWTKRNETKAGQLVCVEKYVTSVEWITANPSNFSAYVPLFNTTNAS